MNELRIHMKGRIGKAGLLLWSTETGVHHLWPSAILSEPQAWADTAEMRSLLAKGFSQAFRRVRPGRPHLTRSHVLIRTPPKWADLETGPLANIAEAFLSGERNGVGALIFLINGRFFLNGGKEVKSFRLPKTRWKVEIPYWSESGCSFDSMFLS